MKNLARWMMGVCAVMLTACSTEAPPRLEGPEEDVHRGVSEQELSMLLAPEPGAAADDYEASVARYRLFGVQLSPVPGESFATLADTSSWAARNVHVGELLGRNLRVAAISEKGLELTGSGVLRVLAPGQEVRLRVIHHRFDKAAVDQGRHQWKVNGSAMAQILGRHGLGGQAEQVQVFSRPALRLSHLQEGGVLARLGLREGDLLFSMDGKPLAPGELGILAERMSVPGSTVRLRVYREASFQELTYSVEAP